MDILVVGSGGREHAIIKKLKESPKVGQIYCAPGNGGICADAQCCPVKATDLSGMVALAQEKQVDFVVVTPDDPLALGMVDALNSAGFATFGPNQAAAQIEASKVFSKNLMKKYGIPTADYETFSEIQAAIAYLNRCEEYPVVIKADGLALGKGVFIAQNRQQAIDAVTMMMQEQRFGRSGSRIVIEEFLTGPEVSVLTFCDGETCVPMCSSMDHKRALDGDLGLNTGGMGTVAPNLCYTSEIAQECMEKIFLPTLAAMRAQGCPFFGCLYFGLMLTPKGPQVIEYNCRFGDPETQVVLPLLKTDLMEVMLAVWEKRLATLPVEFSDQHAACVVLASGGYPQDYEIGKPILGLDENGQCSDATVYHAGTKFENGQYLTAAGRVLGVTCVADTARAALDAAYHAVNQISFEGMHYRTDIGMRNLTQI